MIKNAALRIPLVLLILWALLAAGFNSSNAAGVAAAGLGFWLCLASVLLMVAALLVREWLIAGVVAVLVVITSAWFHVVPGAPFGAGNPKGTSVKVLELNTLLDSASPTAAAKLARTNHVDFAVMAETISKFRPWHNRRLEAELPYHYAVDGATYPSLGNTIFSRWPLVATGQVRGTANPAIWATAKVRGTTVTLLAVRAQNPLINRAQWATDMQLIGSWASLQRSEENLIVAGDFNSTFGHAPFDSLLRKANLTDSAAQVNWPWQRFSYPTRPLNTPLMAIDHVLVSHNYAVKSVDRIYVPLTDHSATVASLTIGAK